MGGAAGDEEEPGESDALPGGQGAPGSREGDADGAIAEDQARALEFGRLARGAELIAGGHA